MNRSPPSTITKGALHAEKKIDQKLEKIAEASVYTFANFCTSALIIGIALIILGSIFYTVDFFLHFSH